MFFNGKQRRKMENMSRFTLLYMMTALFAVASPVKADTSPRGQHRACGLRVENVTAQKSGGHFVVSMDLHFDSVYVASNRMRAYTPVLRGRHGEEVILPSVLLSGRRQHYVHLREGNLNYPEAREIRRVNGTAQADKYVRTLPFEEWMNNAELTLIEDSCGCGLNLASNDHQLLRLRQLRTPLCAYVVPPYTKKTYSLEGRAFLDFPVNRIEIHPDYRRNPEELLKIIETIDRVRNDSNATINAISIHGYASPEGPYDNNIRLSKGRAAALRDYVRQLYRFGDDVRFEVKNTPEDWAGLDSLVRHSNLDIKEELLELIASDMEPDAKNEEIKRRWPDTYRFIHGTWYPALRHSDYVVSYTVRPFTTPEMAKRIYLEKPEQLSLNELYMVANTYEPGSDAFNEVFETALRLFPDNEIANLNAANVAIAGKDLERAEACLKKAGNAPEAIHARGVVALLRGDYPAARRQLEAARDAGVKEAAENLVILEEVEN